MKKLLALMVEHKLNNNNLSAVIDRIETLLNNCDSVTYPEEFKNQMKLALDELRSILSQENYSHHTILDVLEEMERLIVDYLAGIHKESNHHCFL
jgi:hypothetical protein